MQIAIDAARAHARHPELAAAIEAGLAAKYARARQPDPGPAAIAWHYEWAARIGGPRPAGYLPEVHVSLAGVSGRRAEYRALVAPGQSTPAALIPTEIVGAYSNRPHVVAAHFPHVAAFDYSTMGGKSARGLAIAGYRAKSGPPILLVVDDGQEYTGTRPFAVLMAIEGDHLTWQGGLVPAARARLDATPEGGVFRYRNKPLTRLTSAEIRTLAAQGPFTCAA